ncbi:23653_t:CDS:2, partial [Racocetra persica]
RPVAKGSRVPACPTFLMFNFLRMISITLWEVIPEAWSTDKKVRRDEPANSFWLPYNFNDFSQQIKKELKNFSQIVNQAEEELQNIQKEIKGLTKTIEELNAIERELKNIATSLTELNKTGEELKETGENIKGSLDDLGGIKEKIAELAKLEIPLSELEKTVGQEGGKIAKELKEKIG